MKTTHISKDLRSIHGSDESCRMYMIVGVYNGEAEIVIEKTITKRMPIQELEKAERMFELLTGGGGRRVYTLEDLIRGEV